jgi:hypothetical protein
MSHPTALAGRARERKRAVSRPGELTTDRMRGLDTGSPGGLPGSTDEMEAVVTR